MLTTIDLEHCKREVKFPCRVQTAGGVRHFSTVFADRRYTGLEVCMRLAADAPFAEDRLDGTLFQTPYPHVLFKRPGLRHEYTVPDQRDAVFFMYSAADAGRLSAAGLLPEAIAPQVFSLSGELTGMLARFNALLLNSEAFSAADKLDLLGWEILEELAFQRRSGGGTVQAKIRRIASRMQGSVEEDFDPVEQARILGFSPRSFFRHWAEVFPLSPAQYMQELKLKRAAYLLSNTGLSVREIALQLHFCDEHYFSARFRRYFSKTPLEYRRHSTE